jgi:hypothetical protein
MKKSLSLLSTFAFLLSTSALVPSAQAGNAAAATLTTRAAMQKKGLLAADSGNTATSSAGAVTLSKTRGIITTEALTTAGLAAYTLTVTNTLVTTSSIISVEAENGTNTQGTVIKGTVTPGSGSFVVLVQNVHATQALNGTLKLRFVLH